MSANPNSHSIRACISSRCKFNNQQNAQHTFAVHYKHLRPAVQLLVNFKLQLLSYTYVQHSRVTTVKLDCIVNWHVSNQISFEVSFSLKLLVD